ncbi:MAG: protein-disulfide reductase DsbD domain-containing protein [Bacteroidota bacterium]
MRRLVVAVALLLSASAEAQSLLPGAAPPRAADLVEWRVRAERAAPGAEARVILDAQIAEGWRLYAADSPIGIPFVLTLDALPDGVAAQTLRQGTPQTRFDPVFEEDYTYFAGRARFVQPLRLGAGVAAGTHEVTGAVRYALCDDSICLSPARSTFRVALVVE